MSAPPAKPPLPVDRPDFRWACEDCAYFVPEGDGGSGACAHGYPTAPHRRSAPVVETCKEFELA